MARKANENEKPQKLQDLPEEFVPAFTAALPNWAQQVSDDLVQSVQTKGSPGFEPGPEQARQIEQMSALGMSTKDISAILRIEPKLLEKYYCYELETAAARINDRVAKVALQQALCGALPQSTQFWLKTRAGWKETKVTEVTGKNGGPVEFAEVKRRMIETIEAEIADAEVVEDKDPE